MRDYQALYNEARGDFEYEKAQISKLAAENKNIREDLAREKERSRKLTAAGEKLEQQNKLLQKDKCLEFLQEEYRLLLQAVVSMQPGEAGDIFLKRKKLTLKEWEEEALERMNQHWPDVKLGFFSFIFALFRIQAFFLNKVWYLRLRFQEKWLERIAQDKIQKKEEDANKQLDSKLQEREAQFEKDLEDRWVQFEKEKSSIIEEAQADLRKELNQLKEKLNQSKERLGKVTIALIIAVVVVIAFLAIIVW